MKSSLPPTHHRLNIVRIVFLILCTIIVGRLFSLQIINHGKYQVLAAKQHYYKRELIAERGKIYSSDGTLLATTQEAYLLYINPQEVEDVDALVEFLMKNIAFKSGPCLLSEAFDSAQNKKNECKLDEDGMKDAVKEKEESLKQSLSEEGRLWVPIMHGLSASLRDDLDAADMPGVYFESEKVRSYPEKELAAHVLGFVGSDEFGRPTGYFGLEGYYNGELTGTHGYIISEIDASGKPIPIGVFEPTEPKPGMDLVLTIRRELQYMLDQKLKEGVEKYRADYGSYILLNPKTGEVLAMGNYPSFDPGNWNEFLKGESDVSKVTNFKNYAISDNYEPGSVMKALTMSTGLDTGVITPDYIYNDTGPLPVQGYEIRTWNDKYHGNINIAKILQLSDNPGAAHVGMKIGSEKLQQYLYNFGIGAKTGIDLQGEEQGLVKPPSTWTDIDVATAAFGQGISVTPLQLISAMATIANNGVRMQPYVVKELHDPVENETIYLNPKFSTRVISEDTARTMRSMLQSVVDEGEFQWFVQHEGLDNYPIGGKTGTAQIPVAGGYDPNKTNVTFVGFLLLTIQRLFYL